MMSFYKYRYPNEREYTRIHKNTLENSYLIIIVIYQNPLHISRSEQAPRSGFQPVTKITKVFVVFWDLFGAKKVDPKIYVSYGSCAVLVSNIAHQMNDKYFFTKYLPLILEKFH